MSTAPLRRSGVLYERWRDRAACRDADPDLFFPEPGGTPGEHGSAGRAKLICADCPVKAECHDHAMSFPELYGVWGGVAERKRRSMRAESTQTTRLREAAA